MSPETLRQLTKLLGSAPPTDYLRLLDNYPTALMEKDYSAEDPDVEGTVADVELLKDPVDVLAINREARREKVPDPNGEEFIWPAQLLIIGETGTGDYFCMDVLGDVPGILQYNHQAVEFERIADSLAEFVEILHDTFDEEAAEEELTGDEMTDDEMTDEEDCDESEDLSSG